MVSSFDTDVLYELERLNTENNTDIKAIYLYNFYEHRELPDPCIYAQRGHGINISSTKLNKEVIQNCHQNGKLVGVWVNAEAFFEDVGKMAFQSSRIEVTAIEVHTFIASYFQFIVDGTGNNVAWSE